MRPCPPLDECWVRRSKQVTNQPHPNYDPKAVGASAEFLGKFVGGLVLFGISFAAINALVNVEADRGMDRIHNQVADDFERQYQDVTVSGTAMDRCVRAGLVAEGHLQAGNQSAYAQWKRTESRDCRAAGLPQ